MHIKDGELRLVYQKKQNNLLDEASEQHIRSCAQCRKKLEALSARAERVNAEMNALDATQINPMPADAALRRLKARINIRQSQVASWSGMSFAKRKAVWISACLIVGFIVVLMFPSVQALAGRFLNVFRVKQFRVVQIDTENQRKLAQLGSSSTLAQMISDTAKIESKGSVQEPGSMAEASSLAGFQVKIPAALEEQPRWKIQPGIDISMVLDLPRIRTLLGEAGYSEILLPEGLHGSTVSINIPPIAVAFFGDCGQDEVGDTTASAQTSLSPQRSCTTLTQLLTPTATVPGELDADELGLALLQLLGIPAEEASRFSQSVDWTSTFVIPIPQNATSFEEVDINGARGMLIQTNSFRTGRPQRYLLVWTEDGIVYALDGIGSKTDTLTIANSLR